MAKNFKIICNNKIAKFFEERFGSGSKGNCIIFGVYMSPNKFIYICFELENENASKFYKYDYTKKLDEYG